ncbi:hypothetical protein Dimus_019775 [Dionaea muscipula]
MVMVGDYGAVLFSLPTIKVQGQSWCYKKNLSTHTNSSKISQGGAELPEKVVLVRFDASILLLEDVEKHTAMPSSYLYEAGARVILMSNWSTKGNYKQASSGAGCCRYIIYIIVLL